VAFGDFADLYGEVIKRARRDASFASDVTDAKNAVNEAYLEICDDGTQWDYLETNGTFNTAAATSSYTYTTIGTALGVTVTDVLALRQTSGPTMYGVDWSDFERIRGLNTTLSASPEIWTKQSDSQVVLFPTPTGISAITCVARREPTALTNDGDTPLIPLSWRRRVIVPYAVWKLLQQESGDAMSEAERHWTEWERAMVAFKEAHTTTAEVFPHPGPINIPSGLRGSTGTLLHLAQLACYRSRRKPWVDYDLLRAKELINEAHISICDTSDDWDFLEKEAQITVSGGDVYTLSGITTALGLTGSTVSEVLSLVHDDPNLGNGLLDAMPWESLESLSASTQDGELKGYPTSWASWGDDRIRIYPSPDQAYVLGIRYRLLPTTITSDTVEPLIPLGWRERLLVCYAAAGLARESGAHDISDREYAKYQRNLEEFTKAHGSARKPTLRLVAPMWGADLPSDDTGWWWNF
jgi:hypothetical protein